MSIFYQHIGEKLWARDVPRSIGTAKEGLRRFTWHDLEPHLVGLDPLEIASLRQKIAIDAPTGCQVWGLPTGAGRVLSSMQAGDFLMLLESTDFGYAGQVIERISMPQWDLSTHIWGEQKFPLIVLLQGEMISYAWDSFKTHFKFDAKYHMRGTTARVADERVATSSSQTEEAFIAMLLTTQGKNSYDQEIDFKAFASNLQIHFRTVKARAGQQAFRRKLMEKQGCGCAVCGISIAAVIDAAHLVPKEEGGSDDHRNGMVLCSLHHRMFDVGLFAVHPQTLSIHASTHHTLFELKIPLTTIEHLSSKPHRQSLDWRWKWFNAL